jgi:hypothetical protein
VVASSRYLGLKGDVTVTMHGQLKFCEQHHIRFLY